MLLECVSPESLLSILCLISEMLSRNTIGSKALQQEAARWNCAGEMEHKQELGVCIN